MQGAQAFAGGGFKAEEDVEVARQGTPLAQQVRIHADQIDAGLHQDPALANGGGEQGGGQFAASVAVSPEEVVDDEDVRAGGIEIGAHVGRRMTAAGAAIEMRSEEHTSELPSPCNVVSR